MKKIKNIIPGGIGMLCMLILTVACQKLEFSQDKADFDEQGDLGQFSLRLFGFGDLQGGRTANFGEGGAVTIERAADAPEKVDLVSFWSETDGISLVSVWDVPTLQATEDGQMINDEWYVKNETTFIRMEAASTTEDFKERYDALEEAQDVRDLYEWAEEAVTQQPNYDEKIHGPYMSVKGLSPGDLLLAKTESGAYAVAWVESASEGLTGDIQFLVKVDKRAYTPIPALDPSEFIETYETRLERPNATAGIRWLDFSTGDTYVQTNTDYNLGVVYHQEKIDLIYVNSSASAHNFRSIDNSGIGSWGGGQWVIDDWMVRNSSKFIRLEGSAYADSLFAYTFQNSHIRKAWDETEARVADDPDYGEGTGYGPDDYITQIALGDVILFKSESKDIYAVAKVIDHDPAAGGHVVLSVKVDNSAKKEVPPPSQFILTGVPGYKFIDFENGQAVMEVRNEALIYGPEYFDIGHAKGSSSNHNFMSNTWMASDAFDTFSASVKNRVRTWPVINRSELIRLAAGDATDVIYRSLSDGDYTGMQAIWDAAAEEEAPTDRLTGLAVGQVVLINSVDRERFIAVRVLRSNTSQSTGSLAIEYKVAKK